MLTIITIDYIIAIIWKRLWLFLWLQEVKTNLIKLTISATIFLVSLFDFYNTLNIDSFSNTNISNDLFIYQNENSIINSITNSNLNKKTNIEQNEIKNYIDGICKTENSSNNNLNEVNKNNNLNEVNDIIDSKNANNNNSLEQSKGKEDKNNSSKNENKKTEKSKNKEENKLILFEVYQDPNNASNKNVIGYGYATKIK